MLDRRHQSRRRDRPIDGRLMRADAQIMPDLIIIEILEVERDPDTIGGARPPVTVQCQAAHGAGIIMAVQAPKPIGA